MFEVGNLPFHDFVHIFVDFYRRNLCKFHKLLTLSSFTTSPSHKKSPRPSPTQKTSRMKAVFIWMPLFCICRITSKFRQNIKGLIKVIIWVMRKLLFKDGPKLQIDFRFSRLRLFTNWFQNISGKLRNSHRRNIFIFFPFFHKNLLIDLNDIIYHIPFYFLYEIMNNCHNYHRLFSFLLYHIYY